jgi:hypothetical protein
MDQSPSGIKYYNKWNLGTLECFYSVFVSVLVSVWHRDDGVTGMKSKRKKTS